MILIGYPISKNGVILMLLAWFAVHVLSKAWKPWTSDILYHLLQILNSLQKRFVSTGALKIVCIGVLICALMRIIAVCGLITVLKTLLLFAILLQICINLLHLLSSALKLSVSDALLTIASWLMLFSTNSPDFFMRLPCCFFTLILTICFLFDKIL